MSSTLSPSERSYIITGLSHPTSPTRLDGRALLAPRPISISYGDAPQANGSARVVLEGGTEVVAGVRLEVVDVDPGVKGKGKEVWRGKVEVDVTPQAFPQLSSQALSALSAQYASIIADHLIPSIPPLPILPPTKYFLPHLHLTLLSTSSASILSTLLLASRLAFSDLRIPRTKRIGWETSLSSAENVEEKDLSGIKAAVRAGKGKGQRVGRGGGDEWDLDATGEGVEFLDDRANLPVMVTLNLVPGSDAAFIDATPQEEAACPDRLHLFFTGAGRICGMRTEGTDGLDVGRITPLLMEGKRIALELVASLNSQLPR